MRLVQSATFMVVLLLGTVFFAGFFVIPATAQTDTMQFRYNAQHTGDYSPVAGSVPSNGQLKWNYTTGDAVYSSPAVANGIVYVGSDDHNVYALNANTGAKLWNYTTGGDVRSSPAVANNVVYVGSDDGNVYALNATTGAKLWYYTTYLIDNTDFLHSWGSYVAVANGVAYVAYNVGGWPPQTQMLTFSPSTPPPAPSSGTIISDTLG